MNLGKKITLPAVEHEISLAELVPGGREIDRIVEIGETSRGILRHFVIFPESEGSFNRKFAERTDCTADSYFNFLWWYSTRKNGIMHTISKDFAIPSCLDLHRFHWNASIVAVKKDSKVISLVFGHVRLMEMVYAKELRTYQPHT